MELSHVLYTQSRIIQKVGTIALDIVSHAARRAHEERRQVNMRLVQVLNGGRPFFEDLVPRMRNVKTGYRVPIYLDTDSMHVRSYGDALESSGRLEIIKDLEKPVDGLDVIIADDVIDTGITMTGLKELLESRGARSVRVAAVVDKHEQRRGAGVGFKPEYVCFKFNVK